MDLDLISWYKKWNVKCKKGSCIANVVVIFWLHKFKRPKKHLFWGKPPNFISKKIYSSSVCQIKCLANLLRNLPSPIVDIKENVAKTEMSMLVGSSIICL